jgi:type VI secretion system Hcp family effector
MRLLGTATVLLLFALPVPAALNAYMTVEGDVQGPIRGEVTLAGREDQIEIHEMHQLYRVEGGRTVHEALILTTRMGIATPKLLTALDTNENLTVTIFYWRPTQSGQEENYYKMELEGARLVASEPIMPDNKNPDLMQYEVRTRLRLTYGAITHTHIVGGTSATLSP